MRQNLDNLDFILRAEKKSEFACTVGMTRRKHFRTQLTETPRYCAEFLKSVVIFEVLSRTLSPPALSAECVLLHPHRDQSVGSREWKRRGPLHSFHPVDPKSLRRKPQLTVWRVASRETA